MKWALALFTVVHGLVHLLGAAKGLGWAAVPELTHPMSRPAGMLWLLAAVVMCATGVLIVAAPRMWWVAAIGAVLLSQVLIVGVWSDAKFGTIANLIVLAGAVYAFAAYGPTSFRAQFARAAQARAAAAPAALISESDISALPVPVQRYMRVTGSVGRPRVRHFRAAWTGRIRGGADAPWMPFTAEQFNVVAEPSRFFLMDARRARLPVDVFHAFAGGAATMRVRALSLLPVASASGAEMTRAETVTVLNDLCVLAPGALLDPALSWEAMDDLSARVTYTVGANTVSAVLQFNDAGELADFVSDDRRIASEDGSTMTPMRWSTPLSDYSAFGPVRAPRRGAGVWHAPEGAFAYIELELVRLELNGR